MDSALTPTTSASRAPSIVGPMFDRIARRYDLANHVLSMGCDPLWRRAAARSLGLTEPSRVLDLATGTGDLAFSLARHLPAGSRVVGGDIAAEMVARARVKAADRPIDWLLSDALRLPFADDVFDGATIAFGIRNTPDPSRVLGELRRVLRPAGALVVLEFGQPGGRLFGPLFRVYARHVLPRIGGLLTGQRAAYEYLERSSAAFPAGAAFVDLMDQVGFAETAARPLTGGIAWLYRGIS